LVYTPPLAIKERPSDLTPPLAYREVTFPARDDGVRLKGWLIPGVRPDMSLTLARTIIVVHGTRTNREDNDPVNGVRILDWSADLARHGFAVLAFDMRGMGQSPPAPLSLGYFEQRDVLGAVDYLRSGPLC
jgi:pimeloyl-ACP methyl ester carboxylesterase